MPHVQRRHGTAIRRLHGPSAHRWRSSDQVSMDHLHGWSAHERLQRQCLHLHGAIFGARHAVDERFHRPEAGAVQLLKRRLRLVLVLGPISRLLTFHQQRSRDLVSGLSTDQHQRPHPLGAGQSASLSDSAQQDARSRTTLRLSGGRL